MSKFAKIVSAVSLNESQAAREDARSQARAAARPGDWLAMALVYQVHLEGAFADRKQASGQAARVAAHRTLAILLTSHANAEESVLYPDLAQIGENGQATMGYIEQANAKMEMPELANLDLVSPIPAAL